MVRYIGADSREGGSSNFHFHKTFGNLHDPLLWPWLILQLKGLVQIHDNSVIVETEKNAVEVVFVFICDNFVR